MEGDFEVLKRWLKVLEDELYRMRFDQHVYKTVWKVIEESPDLQTRPSHFYAWLHDTHAQAMAMAIRRLRDPRRKTISLVTFLTRLKGDPSVVSRRHYASLFPPSFPNTPGLPREARQALRKHMINREYDRLVGHRQNQPTAEQLDEEINELQRLANRVVGYATKRIAHYDEEPPEDLPSLDEFDVVLDYAEELIRKYILLFHAVSTEFGIHIQYDWLAPFRVAWIREEDSRRP